MDTRCPGDPTNPVSVDNQLVALVGNLDASVQPVVIKTDQLSRTNELHSPKLSAIIGVSGHGVMG